MLKNLLLDSSIGADVSLENIATQTAALVASDLSDLVSLANVAASERVAEVRCVLFLRFWMRLLINNSRKLGVSLQDIELAGCSIMAADFEHALGQARASFSASIGAPSIPKVFWDDVGGLVSVKADILDTIQLPLQHPEVFADGMKRRSGIIGGLYSFFFFSAEDTGRHLVVWTPRHWQNSLGQSCGNILFLELLLSQGARAPEYVYRRVGSKCTASLPTCQGRAALCYLF